jgi:DNA-binding transcriptional ArsR family regulator
MAKESFVLVSLQEDKAKALAQVISNDSCRKILDYLADKQDTTASDLAKKLTIPLPTVHYNLKHLMQAKLIESDEYHYSEKGKEVNHYKLANKYVIIAPKTTHGLKEKLRSILPVALISGLAASTIPFLQKVTQPTQTSLAAAPTAFAKSADSFQEAAVAPAQLIAESAPTIVTEPNLALWFLFGSLFAIAIMLLVEWIRSKNKK